MINYSINIPSDKNEVSSQNYKVYVLDIVLFERIFRFIEWQSKAKRANAKNATILMIHQIEDKGLIELSILYSILHSIYQEFKFFENCFYNMAPNWKIVTPLKLSFKIKIVGKSNRYFC